MAEEVYPRLREFLNRLPGGFPATPEGVELKILKKLFSPEEAELAMRLTYLPEPPASIAARLGRPEAEAAKQLEEMAKKGLIYRVRVSGAPFYMALQFVIGIYEFHLNSLDRELAELMEEYMPHLRRVWLSTRTKQLRIAPAVGAVDVVPRVETYDRVRDLVQTRTRISVSPCICRKEMALLGKPCSKPMETCLQFGNAANFYIENGMGREVSKEETLALLDLAEKNALVISPSNTQDVLNICLCCGCCCGILRGLKSEPRPADHVHASFQAQIDHDRCDLCRTCLERCQVQAIRETGSGMEVDLHRCIGCGLCLSSCPPQAITFVHKNNAAPPPKTITDMAVKIMRERGLI